jgi:hypothetical protein
MVSPSKGTLHIYKETTILLLTIKGFCITVYPFTQFQYDKGAKLFSLYKSKDIFELHLGLFGFMVTHHTKHRPKK